MEKDLFNPIKGYFEKQGFVCDGEVEGIDLYMEKGDVAEIGTHEQLMERKGKYAALYNSQFA